MHQKSCLSCLLIAVGVCALAVILAVSSGFLKIGLDRSDCGDVVQGFAKSMRQNKMEVARSFASPEQWDRIAAWMAEREGVACSFSLEPDENQSWWGLALCHDQPGKLCTDFGSMCTRQDRVYHFSISNVVLQKDEDRCLVVGWDAICEDRGNDEGENCY